MDGYKIKNIANNILYMRENVNKLIISYKSVENYDLKMKKSVLSVLSTDSGSRHRAVMPAAALMVWGIRPFKSTSELLKLT